MSVASIELPLGVLLLAFGVGFGGWNWLLVLREGVTAPAGTVILSALPTLMGLQLVLAFLSHDIAVVPWFPLHKKLRKLLPPAK